MIDPRKGQFRQIFNVICAPNSKMLHFITHFTPKGLSRPPASLPWWLVELARQPPRRRNRSTNRGILFYDSLDDSIPNLSPPSPRIWIY